MCLGVGLLGLVDFFPVWLVVCFWWVSWPWYLVWPLVLLVVRLTVTCGWRFAVIVFVGCVVVLGCVVGFVVLRCCFWVGCFACGFVRLDFRFSCFVLID